VFSFSPNFIMFAAISIKKFIIRLFCLNVVAGHTPNLWETSLRQTLFPANLHGMINYYVQLNE